MLFFCGCCVITLWGWGNCSTSSVVTLGSWLAASCKQPTLSPDKAPQGIRPICDARQYFIHMCSGILHPSLYSCAHTSATSSPFKAWALQHEIDVQSHLSSCVLQLEELKVVFQISKVFRCQIFIVVQHMASWLLFFFFQIALSNHRLVVLFQILFVVIAHLGPLSQTMHFIYRNLLLNMARGWHFVLTDQHPSPISFVTNWTPQKHRVCWVFLRSARDASIRTRCCRTPFHAASIFALTSAIYGNIRG